MERIKTITDAKTGEILDRKTLTGNMNFVMLFKHNLNFVAKIAQTDGKALSVFLFLIEHMGNDNSIIVSREAIAEMLDISVATVDRKIKYLKDHGFIKTIKSGTSSVYFINADIAWSSTAEKKEYATFRSAVFVTKTEQDKTANDIQKALKSDNVEYIENDEARELLEHVESKQYNIKTSRAKIVEVKK